MHGGYAGSASLRQAQVSHLLNFPAVGRITSCASLGVRGRASLRAATSCLPWKQSHGQLVTPFDAQGPVYYPNLR